MNRITLYGIKNCDSVKKARAWLAKQGVEYQFHDFRSDGLETQQVQTWLQEFGLTLINKRSTSWKALDEQTREALSLDTAVELILAQPTLIKRPLLDTGGRRLVGFSEASYADTLK